MHGLTIYSPYIYIYRYCMVGKFQGCLNFVNFVVGLKSQNLTPTTSIGCNTSSQNKIPHKIL